MTAASPAAALQPLKAFVEGARTYNNTNRAAAATRAQASASASEALGSALPSIDVRGVVAYSQFQPQFPGQQGAQMSELIPRTTWFTSAGLTVPINVGAWEKTASARSAARAAEAGQRASFIDVERDVTRAYYDVVGSEAVFHAAEHNRDLATQNLGVVKALTKEGESSTLDAERALAEEAQAEQDVATADGNVLIARRRLLSLTGVDPQAVAAMDVAVDDLHPEAPLSQWAGVNPASLPKVQEAEGTREAAERSLSAARAKWLPTISGSAMENYTNATENLGRKDFYTLLGLATWHLDLSTGPAVSAQHAAVDGARAREQQARIDAADAIYDAWVQVRTDITKARAARVQSQSAAHATELARAKFAAGEATQIDVLTALQTYLQAEVSRIRVESDLAYARSALRLSVSDGRR